MGVVVEQYGPAKGADALFASDNGRYLTAQYNFRSGNIRPLIKVIDRNTGGVIATARGELAGAPNDDGDAFYLALDDARHPRLRSTMRPAYSVELDPGPTGKEPNGQYVLGWNAYRTATRVIVIRWDHVPWPVETSLWTASVRTDAPKIESTRVIPAGQDFRLLEGRSAPCAASGRLIISVATPQAESKGFIAALDERTLEESWRTPWRSNYLFYPGLGVSGDDALAVAFTGDALHVISTADGATQGLVRFPFVEPRLRIRGWPGKRAVVVMRQSDNQAVPMGLNDCDVVLVELPSGKTTQLWNLPNHNQICPSSFAVVGERVLLAPGVPGRSADRASWGPEVAPYVDH